MIDSAQLVNGLWMGTLLILLGLVPGLLQKLLEGTSAFAARVQTQWPLTFRVREQFKQIPWLAAAGAFVILATLLAWVCR